MNSDSFREAPKGLLVPGAEVVYVVRVEQTTGLLVTEAVCTLPPGVSVERLRAVIRGSFAGAPEESDEVPTHGRPGSRVCVWSDDAGPHVGGPFISSSEAAAARLIGAGQSAVHQALARAKGSSVVVKGYRLMREADYLAANAVPEEKSL